MSFDPDIVELKIIKIVFHEFIFLKLKVMTQMGGNLLARNRQSYCVC